MKPSSVIVYLLLIPLVVVLLVLVNAYLYRYTTGQSLYKTLTSCNEFITELSTVPHVTTFDNSQFAGSSTPSSGSHSYQIDVVGTRRQRKGFLTVGVPSIKRINGPTYLIRTLSSLVERTAPQDRWDVTVVVFLADDDTSYNNESLHAVADHFSDHLDSGFFQLVTVSPDYYPPLDGLKRNFGDSPDRVRWRAKQVADFALLFTHSRNISEYYVQIEDDVTCARDFVGAIRRYVADRNRAGPWTTLEFSELGFIGKLVQSSDLDRLTEFMRTFYAEQPVDWLVSYFRTSAGQEQILLRKPTLFQHFGTRSSFDLTKDNFLKDRFFDAGDGPWSNADNPSATVLSTMPHYKQHSPDMAYSSGTGYFWATKSVVGDAIHVVFDTAQNLSRIVVQTGNAENPHDTVDNASIHVSSSVTRSERGVELCADGERVTSFVNGQAYVEHLETRLDTLTRCMKIIIDSNHDHWLLFSRIAVFLA